MIHGKKGGRGEGGRWAWEKDNITISISLQQPESTKTHVVFFVREYHNHAC